MWASCRSSDGWRVRWSDEPGAIVKGTSYKPLALLLGPMLFAAVLFAPPFASFLSTASTLGGGSSSAAELHHIAVSMKTVLGLLLWMGVWWLTDAVPMPVTALLPPFVLPWFDTVDIQGSIITPIAYKTLLSGYANPVIYLFLGGFLMAAAMQKWKVDRRLTYWLLTRSDLANRSRYVVLVMMGLTAFLSMFISNTAAAAMMLPIGWGIVSHAGGTPGQSKFGTALMLGIAWGASIGGVGTLIGTPPNGIAIGILNATLEGTEGYHRITFFDWMTFGVPLVAVFLPAAWLILVKLFPPETDAIAGGRNRLKEAQERLGPMETGGKLTVGVFLLALALWLSNPFWAKLFPPSVAAHLSGVDEFTIGLGIGVLLLLLPVDRSLRTFVLSWEDTRYVDWGILVLFGGGIALSDVMFRSGVADWIAGTVVGVTTWGSTVTLVVAIVLIVVLLSEVTSNTAVATMMAPIMISIGRGMEFDPVTLVLASALASSLGFMLPVATPPNAIVFGTGYVRLRDMIRSGAILDLTGAILVVVVLWLFGSMIFHVVRF
jgi:sodium-dependent dicarboxylate transporter 2/3/5